MVGSFCGYPSVLGPIAIPNHKANIALGRTTQPCNFIQFYFTFTLWNKFY